MKNKIYLLICSVLLAIFWVPTIFLGEIISYKHMVFSFLYFAGMAFLYAVMLRSNKPTESIIKWLISLPISYLLFQYYWKTNYALRALNWVFEGYGKQSAGGGFAFMVQISAFCFFCIIAAFGVYQINIPNQKLQKIQVVIGSVIGVIIVFITLFLESVFPAYSSIFLG